MHRVYMSFILLDEVGWRCHFLAEDLETPFPKRVTVRDPDKIREAVVRAHYGQDGEARQALDQAIEIGHGGLWLELTDVQYRALQRNKLQCGSDQLMAD